MQACDLIHLKDFILLHNGYLHCGFANVVKDTNTSRIWTDAGTDKVVVFPADTHGNYCYLRNDGAVKHEPLPAERLTDNGPQRLVFLDTTIVHLVAIVKNADAWQLVENLRNTVMMYEAMNVQSFACNINREEVVAEELSGFRADDVNAALQRLKNETIVKLSLRVSKLFTPSACILNPCKL